MNPNYLNHSIDVKRERRERRGSIDNKSTRVFITNLTPGTNIAEMLDSPWMYFTLVKNTQAKSRAPYKLG